MEQLLRRNRMVFIRGLKDVDMEKLLETPQLEHIFTQYQKDEILSRQVSHERVGKCLDFVEAKGNAACQKLTDVVEQLGLLKLNPVAHQRSNDLSPSPYHSHSLSPQLGEHKPMAQGKESAGPYGLNGHGPGPNNHLSKLSYNSRELLAAKLNGTPANRIDFCTFCHIYGVDDSLEQASLHSRNPTAYLLQELSSKPDATFNKLRNALEKMGKGELFNDLWRHLDEEDGGVDACE